MIRLSNARLAELCRESARHGLARSVRAASVSGRRPASRWLRRDRSVVEVAVAVAAPPVSLPTPTPTPTPTSMSTSSVAQAELRRSA